MENINGHKPEEMDEKAEANDEPELSGENREDPLSKNEIHIPNPPKEPELGEKSEDDLLYSNEKPPPNPPESNNSAVPTDPFERPPETSHHIARLSDSLI